jgi:hypothetical protein
MIGRMLMTGPVEAAPTRVCAQPHSKTATTAPSEAPIDKRNPSAALIGTTIDRNLINNRTNARPTTRAANGTSEELSRSERSMLTAVGPVTETAAPSAAAIPGARARMVLTRSVVALSCGPLRGMTSTTAVLPSLPSWGGVTVSTSGSVLTSAATVRASILDCRPRDLGGIDDAGVRSGRTSTRSQH